MRTSQEKPWWERVADFNDADQENFLRGVYQASTTYRPKQPQSYIMGLAAGYRNREFVQPESYKGRPNGKLF
jgi:hypothetical protein